MKRRMLKWVWSFMVCTGFSVYGAMIVPVGYEGFDYDEGGYLGGQTGGTGWSGGWSANYSGELQFFSPGYTYPNLSVRGNAAQFGTGGAHGISEATRSLEVQNEGVVYIQCLFKSGVSGIGAGTPQLRLSLSGTGWTGGLGGNDWSTCVSILDSGMQPSGVSTAPLTDLNLLVYKIDYDAGESYLWTNPDLAVFDYLNPVEEPDATAAFAPAFDTLSIYFRDGASIDELSIMAVVSVPEPGTVALLAAGLFGLWVCRWKRRKPAR
ncbi:MAG: PEP-CTERM sorting domain-containing protein [Kiritimatiellae bacterium]|nr:PEP-CTERM sorting domain-containing protein [Kiritimatiellia bacterium]